MFTLDASPTSQHRLSVPFLSLQSLSLQRSRSTLQFKLLRILLYTILTAALVACGSPLQRGPASTLPVQAPSENLAKELIIAGNTAQAAQVYEELSRSETDLARQTEYSILAAELYFDSELYNQGAQIVATLPPQFADESMQQRRDILNAYYSLAQLQPDQALQQLPQVRVINDRIQRIRVLEIQARAHDLMRDPVQSLKTRILLEANLSRPESINLNREKIWQMLSKLELADLQTMAKNTGRIHLQRLA